MHFNEYDIECLNKAKAFIDADISTHITIAILAHRSGIGETKLKKGFKEYYGRSLFTYLRIQRMIKARQLILETNKTIKQIAKETGFRHPNNFTKAFSSYYHVAPNRYRKLYSSE
jgi:AraC family transcriptional regulator, transcriptional activator of the genes for pyochelin and ferripyochelin receptors